MCKSDNTHLYALVKKRVVVFEKSPPANTVTWVSVITTISQFKGGQKVIVVASFLQRINHYHHESAMAANNTFVSALQRQVFIG